MCLLCVLKLLGRGDEQINYISLVQWFSYLRIDVFDGLPRFIDIDRRAEYKDAFEAPSIYV